MRPIGMQRGPCIWQTSTGRVCLESSASKLSGSQVDSQPPAFRHAMEKLNRTLAFPLPAPEAVAPASRPPNFGDPCAAQTIPGSRAAGRVPGVSRVSRPQFGSPTTPRQIFPPKLPQLSLAPAHCTTTARPPLPAFSGPVGFQGCSLAPGHPGHLAGCCAVRRFLYNNWSTAPGVRWSLPDTAACARARGACVCRILVIALWPTAPERRH